MRSRRAGESLPRPFVFLQCLILILGRGRLTATPGQDHRLFGNLTRHRLSEKLQRGGFAEVGGDPTPLTRERADRLAQHIDDATAVEASRRGRPGRRVLPVRPAMDQGPPRTGASVPENPSHAADGLREREQPRFAPGVGRWPQGPESNSTRTLPPVRREPL